MKSHANIHAYDPSHLSFLPTAHQPTCVATSIRLTTRMTLASSLKLAVALFCSEILMSTLSLSGSLWMSRFISW